MSDKINVVFAQVRAPKESDGSDGVVVEGRYKVVDNEVILTNRAGVAVQDQHGKFYRQKLRDGESAHAIAGRLTKLLRLTLLGKDPDRVGVRREIQYPKVGLA